jgi:hypothetical protein
VAISETQIAEHIGGYFPGLFTSRRIDCTPDVSLSGLADDCCEVFGQVPSATDLSLVTSRR